MVFNVHFLPARYGDSIWIEYGYANNPMYILIDGGTAGTKTEIKGLLDSMVGKKELELLVVTHIDRDHIEGILSLLEEDQLDVAIRSIWFNGWGHLPENDLEPFGPVQGERLSAAILKHNINWNGAFGGKSVALPENGSLPEITLPGGMKLTLLAPTLDALKKLKVRWKAEVEAANLDPGFGLEPLDEKTKDQEIFGPKLPDVEALLMERFDEDNAVANGSSIAFLAEYGNKTVLFAGDAYPSVIEESLNKRYKQQAPIDLVKLSHHASAGNTSPQLIKKLDCLRYVVSTNGSIFKHPSAVTLARILGIKGAGVEFIFNYKSDHNACWDHASLKANYAFSSRYPDEGKKGIVIPLL